MPASRTRALRPGRPARGTRSGRPIMVLLDLLGRRWTLRVLWELREDVLVFRALQERCGGIAPSVLNTRLAELKGAGLVGLQDGGGYELTRVGRELLRALAPLEEWSQSWTRALADS
jgi:DNA-binding HxlR family transcriptional regulator